LSGPGRLCPKENCTSAVKHTLYKVKHFKLEEKVPPKKISCQNSRSLRTSGGHDECRDRKSMENLYCTNLNRATQSLQSSLASGKLIVRSSQMRKGCNKFIPGFLRGCFSSVTEVQVSVSQPVVSKSSHLGRAKSFHMTDELCLITQKQRHIAS
jgi:hypothetical protein